MSSNVVISGRGQITLPADLRKKYEIKDGDVLIIEERNGEILLKPAKVFEVDYYGEEQINEWIKEDKFTSEEKKKIIKKSGRSK